MKKFIITLITVVASAAMAFADYEEAISPDRLPAQAKEFIAQHFAGEEIVLAKIEYDYPSNKYEVIFKGGTKVGFNNNGEWRTVECMNSPIPEALVPARIKSKAEELFPGTFIRQIDKDRRKIEVELSNRLELTFDMNLNLVDIDD